MTIISRGHRPCDGGYLPLVRDDGEQDLLVPAGAEVRATWRAAHADAERTRLEGDYLFIPSADSFLGDPDPSFLA